MEGFSFKRVLNPLEMWSYGYGCLLGWGGFVMPATVFLPQAGVWGSLMGFAVGGLFVAIIGLNYYFLLMQVEGSGGIFYLLQKNMGRIHAFVASWGICFAHLLIIPLNARAFVRLVWAVVLEMGGTVPELRVFGVSTPLLGLLIIAAMLALFGFVNAQGVKLSARLQTVFAVTMALGIFVLFFMAIFSGVDIRAQMSPALPEGVSRFKAFMLLFIMIPWAFVGFDSIPAMSREKAFSKDKLGAIMVWAVLIGTFGYMANVVITVLGAPTLWTLYIQDIGTGLDSIAVVAAMRRLYGDVGTAIAMVTLLCAILSGINGTIANISRHFYTMARSNSLFLWLGKTNDKGVPYTAIIFSIVGAIALVLVSNTFNTMEMVASCCTAFGYGYISYAALRGALRKRNKWYIVTGAGGLGVCIVWFLYLLIPFLGTNDIDLSKMYWSMASWILIGIWGYAYTCRKPDLVLQELELANEKEG